MIKDDGLQNLVQSFKSWVIFTSLFNSTISLGILGKKSGIRKITLKATQFK